MWLNVYWNCHLVYGWCTSIIRLSFLCKFWIIIIGRMNMKLHIKISLVIPSHCLSMSFLCIFTWTRCKCMNTTCYLWFMDWTTILDKFRELCNLMIFDVLFEIFLPDVLSQVGQTPKDKLKEMHLPLFQRDLTVNLEWTTFVPILQYKTQTDNTR